MDTKGVTMKRTTPEVIQIVKEQLESICRASEAGMTLADNGDGKGLDGIARDLIAMARVVKDVASELDGNV